MAHAAKWRSRKRRVPQSNNVSTMSRQMVPYNAEVIMWIYAQKRIPYNDETLTCALTIPQLLSMTHRVGAPLGYTSSVVWYDRLANFAVELRIRAVTGSCIFPPHMRQHTPTGWEPLPSNGSSEGSSLHSASVNCEAVHVVSLRETTIRTTTIKQ